MRYAIAGVVAFFAGCGGLIVHQEAHDFGGAILGAMLCAMGWTVAWGCFVKAEQQQRGE